jgi:hypothetical protein
VEVSCCRRMSLFLKDTHESHDSIRKPLVRTGNRAALTPRTQAASSTADANFAALCSCIRQAHCTTSHTSDRPRRSRHRPRPPPVATAVAH